MKKEERYRLFAETVWDWFARHKRTLPWRDLKLKDRNRRAYMILVSEVMLQQTQVPRVVPAFKAFIERFPSADVLAKASNKEILVQWRGMGYNSRALRLRDAAMAVVGRFDGRFPDDMDSLLTLKGVGEYTAAAVRNFAFAIPTACIDVNIRRILHRAFVGPENADGTWDKDDVHIGRIAEEVLHAALETGRGTCADWHAALMDYGSLICTRRSPKWEICPLTKRGLMKAAYKTPVAIKKTKKEPGRMVGSVFIPNRIFRGRIVEALRDAERGLTVPQIGPLISKDWNKKEHETWLEGLLLKLVKDELLIGKTGLYRLHQ